MSIVIILQLLKYYTEVISRSQQIGISQDHPDKQLAAKGAATAAGPNL